MLNDESGDELQRLKILDLNRNTLLGACLLDPGTNRFTIDLVASHDPPRE